MQLSFSQLWQQSELSDVNVLLTAPPAADQEGDAPAQKLTEFPGHTVLLSTSPYLKAQILRWQRKRPHDGAPAEVGTSNSSTQHTHQDAGRPQLVLTLQDAIEQPAAMAVLAALYGAKPMPELLSELSQEQHLQAAMLADMWQLPAISTAAAFCLADCLKSQGTLPEAVTQQLLRLQAVPDCLQPLFKQVLLRLLGSLEQCWADSALSDQLLQLPLSSMELLLSSDELKVASEDTVLYTVQRYMDASANAATKQHIRERLGPLIRCQHLSHYWLLLSVMSDDADRMPLKHLRPQMKQLLVLGSLTRFKATATPAELKGALKGAPPSWELGQRSIITVSRVELTWELDVSTLRETAQHSAAQQSRSSGL